MHTIFKFVECDLNYDVYFFAPDGTQLIFLSFDKKSIDRKSAFKIASKIFCEHF